MIKPSHPCVLALALFPAALGAQQPSFTIDQVMAPPFPDELVAAPAGGGAVAWVFNARGARNVWVAAPPDYRGKAVTSYAEDDGQELADLRWTPDGRAIVYVRGDRKSTRLNSSHRCISYAVFCLKKKKNNKKTSKHVQ